MGDTEANKQIVREFHARRYVRRRPGGRLCDKDCLPTYERTRSKYRFPTGYRKSLVFFNLHRALRTHGRTVIVVEGFFDTFAVHQAGYQP
jgi:DNA primase